MERIDGTSTSDLGTVSVQPNFTTIKVKTEPQDDDIKNEKEMEDHGKKTPTEILPSSYHRSSSTATSSLSIMQSLPHSPHTEDQNTTITDYAETTMNELLGMYGYEKVSHQDTQNLNLDRYTATSTPDTSLQGLDDTHLDSEEEDSSDALSIGGPDRKSSSNGETTLAAQHRNLVSALNKRLSHDSGGGYNNENLPSGYIICAWCQKPGVKLFTLKTLNGSKVFCSEVCFTQCRRASFKKNKICDWCKHVRHTVNYVDFQDGEQQLQFCSEKCLNQYKMNIFCQETQEHLQQIQASIDNNSSSNDVSDKQILITPDLWLQEDMVRRHKKIRTVIEDKKHSDTNNKEYSDKPKDLSNHVESPETSGLSNMVEKTNEKPNLDKSLKERLAKRLHKDPTHTASPNVTPLQKRPHPGHSHFVPSMFPNPAMNNWWHHAQMLASLGPGYPAFGSFPPVMYPGMFNPPFNPMMPSAPPIPESSRPHSRHINATSTPGPVGTPNANVSPDISQRQSQSPAVTPNAANKSSIPRNHQLPPMWPPVFPMMPMPSQMPQQGEPNLHTGPNSTVPTFPIPAPNWSSMGIPPQTVMIPFPLLFPLPFPVPIPIPVPMKAEQIEKLLNRVSCISTNSSSNNKEDETSSECEDIKPQNLHDHLNLSMNHQSNNNSSSSNSSHNNFDSSVPLSQPRTTASNTTTTTTAITKNIPKECITCASCITPSKSTVLPRPSSVLSMKSDSHVSLTEVNGVKRPPTPASVSSIESVKRVRHESMNSNYDEVIDLSKDSSRESAQQRERNSPQVHHILSEHKTINSVRSTSVPLPNVSGNGEKDFLHVPKIHIVSTPTDPPLSQHLPLPPTDHAYSMRRGLILDAPSVPKRPKSPSPERRNYIRSMPRDIMEARRCLRTRIKTK